MEQPTKPVIYVLALPSKKGFVTCGLYRCTVKHRLVRQNLQYPPLLYKVFLLTLLYMVD